ncbi:hypothetical protein ES705_18573 [subsurface metagenome]|nr:MAG: hypothetical protein ES695_18180 [Candidatus Atribacteria bacterium 1244-E10-H5-B2]
MLNKEEILELNELVEEIIGDKEDNISIEKKISEEGIKALHEALSMLSKYQEDFPDDLSNALKLLAKYAGYGAYASAKHPVKKGNFPSIVEELKKAGGNMEIALEKLEGSSDDSGKKFPSFSKYLETDNGGDEE